MDIDTSKETRRKTMATWLADMADLPGIEIKMEGGGWASGRLDWAKEKEKAGEEKKGKRNGSKERKMARKKSISARWKIRNLKDFLNFRN